MRIDLTPQEREALRLAAEGCSNPEIAAAMVVSSRTIQNYLQAVYSKLGLRKTDGSPRVKAVIWYRERYPYELLENLRLEFQELHRLVMESDNN